MYVGVLYFLSKLMHAVTSYVYYNNRNIVRGRVYSSLLISRVDVWIMATTHHTTVRCDTSTTVEDTAELLEDLGQNKLVPVYALNTGQVRSTVRL